MAIAIWVGALLLYLAFRFWYDGPRKPLTADEVEKYMRLLEQRADVDAQDLAVMRKFLEEDDGKDFIMVNLLQFHRSPIKHPDTGRDVQADSVLQEYFRPFMGQVMRRAGHPVLSTRAVGATSMPGTHRRTPAGTRRDWFVTAPGETASSCRWRAPNSSSSTNTRLPP